MQVNSRNGATYWPKFPGLSGQKPTEVTFKNYIYYVILEQLVYK